MAEGLRVNRTLVVPDAELQIRATRSGGPGGQHANTSDTAVEVVFDVEASSVLGPRQRSRLLDRFGTQVRAVASDSRSQARNRELARQRLARRLAEALRTPKSRRPSRPSAAARRRRIEHKRRRGELKRSRRKPGHQD